MIREIDMELLDNQRDSFDLTDTFMFETENFMSIYNFIDYLKKENCYELIKDKLNEYLDYYHKYDIQELENSSTILQNEVLNSFTDMIDNSLIYEEN